MGQNNKKKILIFITAAAIVIVSCVVGAVVTQPRTPAISVDGDSAFDFGQGWSGDTVQHKFVISNSSRQTVTIADIKTSCTCTIANSPAKQLAPNTSTPIDVSVHLGAAIQQLISSVVITFSSGERIKLTVHGMVDQQNPDVVAFVDWRRDQPTVRSFKIKSRDGRPVTVSRLDFNKEHFDVLASPAAAGDAGVVITVKPTQRIPDGIIDEDLGVSLVGSSEKYKVVHFGGNVVGPLETEPNELVFGVSGQQGTDESEIVVRSTYGDSLKRVSAESDKPKAFKIKSVSEIAADGSVRIAVESLCHQSNAGSPKVEKGNILVTAVVGDKTISRSIECYALQSE